MYAADMFAIGGNVAVPRYRKTKYEPLEAVFETQQEVGQLFFLLFYFLMLFSFVMCA